MYYQKRPSKKAKKGYTWCVKFYYTDRYGFRKRYTKSGFETKAAAQAHAVKIQEDMKQIGDIPQERTFGQVWQEWLKLNSQKLAPGTLDGYVRIYQNHLIQFDNRIIRSITLFDLQSLFSDSDYSKGFNRTMKSVLQNIFKFARKSGYITHNPVQDIEVSGKEKSAPEDALSLSDVESICQAIYSNNSSRMDHKRKETLKTFLYIGYYSGLRIGEILALQKQDIDFDTRTIRVWKKTEEHSGHPEISYTLKTKTSYGFVPICEPLYEILSEYCQDLEDAELLIANACGGIMAKSNLGATLKREAAKAGIPGFHAHMLRHAFVTNIIRSGADPKTAAQLARHSRVTTTLDIYTQMNSDDLAAAVCRAYPKRPKKDPKSTNWC